MPNVDVAYGFRPWGGYLSIKRFEKDASAARLFRHDLVAVEADGACIPAAAGSQDMVGSAAAGSAVSTAEDILVYDDPNQKFEAQDDGVGATLAATNVGNMGDHLATTGSTVTGISAHEIDASSVATTAGLGFLILDLVNRPGNAWGINADLVVTFNEHIRKFVYGDTTTGGRAGI